MKDALEIAFANAT